MDKLIEDSVAMIKAKSIMDMDGISGELKILKDSKGNLYQGYQFGIVKEDHKAVVEIAREWVEITEDPVRYAASVVLKEIEKMKMAMEQIHG
ncbi:MAG: hypothetical protein WC373_06670 [Smithella sp.]|jgi:hypothetical protein